MNQIPGKPYAIGYTVDLPHSIKRDIYLMEGYHYRVYWCSGIRVHTVGFYKTKQAAIRRRDKLNASI